MRRGILVRRRMAECAWLGLFALAGVSAAIAFEPLPTTLNDFHGPGTQPLGLTEGVMSAVIEPWNIGFPPQALGVCGSPYGQARRPASETEGAARGPARTGSI